MGFPHFLVFSNSCITADIEFFYFVFSFSCSTSQIAALTRPVTVVVCITIVSITVNCGWGSIW
jgi:hypothetical protein